MSRAGSNHFPLPFSIKSRGIENETNILCFSERIWPFVHGCSCIRGKGKVCKGLGHADAILKITLEEMETYGIWKSKL